MTNLYTELNGSGKIKLYCLLQDGSKKYLERTYTPKELKDRILTDKKVTITIDEKVKELLKPTNTG